MGVAMEVKNLVVNRGYARAVSEVGEILKKHMFEQEIMEKLDDIIARLERLENRLGSIDPGEKKT
jgi:hypothetical protein